MTVARNEDIQSDDIPIQLLPKDYGGESESVEAVTGNITYESLKPRN